MKTNGIESLADTGRAYSWFGQRVVWGGLETNRLCQVFVGLCQLDNKIRE
jgi:hypothetical protein